MPRAVTIGLVLCCVFASFYGVRGLLPPGHEMLAHEIAEKAGRPHRGPTTMRYTLDALEDSPLFEKTRVRMTPDDSGRTIRRFVLIFAGLDKHSA